MASICQSTKYIQEEHYHQIKVKTHRRVKSTQLSSNYQYQPYHSKDQIDQYQYSSQNYLKQSPFNNKSKGLYLTYKNNQSKGLIKKQKVDLKMKFNQKSLFQDMQVPHSSRTVNNIITESPSTINSIAERKVPKMHQPHPVIAHRSKNPIVSSPRNLIACQQFFNNKTKPANKPNISILRIPMPKKQQSTKGPSPSVSRGFTPKKQYSEDARHSEETASNKNSSNVESRQAQNLKKAQIFESENIKINLNQIERKTSQFNIPSSPKKILEDAKSIISRDEQLSKLEDFLFEQSFLLEHDLDVFTNVRPINLNNYKLAQAVDKRTGQEVTLKYFSSKQQEQCHKQLQMFQLIEGLGNEQNPLRFLKFRQSLVCDNKGEKEMVFVYQSFTHTLFQHLSIMKGKVPNISFYIQTLIDEIYSLLHLLSINGLILNKPLYLEDILVKNDTWYFHSMSKFTFDMNKIEFVDKRFLEQLRHQLMVNF